MLVVTDIISHFKLTFNHFSGSEALNLRHNATQNNRKIPLVSLQGK